MEPVTPFRSFLPTETALHFIIKQIALRPEQKKCVFSIVSGFLNMLTKRFQEQSKIFSSMRYLVCGSYRDGIKISQSDEFDFNVVVELPEAVVETDTTSPGFVKINLNKCLKYDEISQFLRKMIDSDGFLQVRAFQAWFESLVARAGINQQSISICGHMLRIKTSKSGPAHKLNIEIKSAPPDSPLDDFKFSIDLVPGLLFGQDMWCSQIMPPQLVHEWIAIPKPINGAGNNEHNLFIPSYPKQESYLMNDKNNLKNVIRLFKKLRDRHSICNLKSYFIKTIFLFIHKSQKNKFWDRPCEEILVDSLEITKVFLEKRALPFYWHRQYNMLSKFSTTQIDSMRIQIESLIKKFKKRRNSLGIIDLFLSSAEKEQLVQSKRQCS